MQALGAGPGAEGAACEFQCHSHWQEHGVARPLPAARFLNTHQGCQKTTHSAKTRQTSPEKQRRRVTPRERPKLSESFRFARSPRAFTNGDGSPDAINTRSSPRRSNRSHKHTRNTSKQRRTPARSTPSRPRPSRARGRARRTSRSGRASTRSSSGASRRRRGRRRTLGP